MLGVHGKLANPSHSRMVNFDDGLRSGNQSETGTAFQRVLTIPEVLLWVECMSRFLKWQIEFQYAEVNMAV